MPVFLLECLLLIEIWIAISNICCGLNSQQKGTHCSKSRYEMWGSLSTATLWSLLAKVARYLVIWRKPRVSFTPLVLSYTFHIYSYNHCVRQSKFHEQLKLRSSLYCIAMICLFCVMLPIIGWLFAISSMEYPHVQPH